MALTKRSALLQSRVTPTVRSKLQEACELLGISESEYIRRQVMAGLKKDLKDAKVFSENQN